ncbi:MAG TPA: family 16 glycoside hydrolase [Candidatus Binatia bacterium]|nr:family 16 glycoside hydrolase [Candidatus Binatia bacterium]
MNLLSLGASLLLLSGAVALAEIKPVIDHNDNEHATAAFKFKTVPAPSATDAATKATFTIVDGERDDNGGDLDKLHDGKVPTEEDQPAENFFFNAGTEGGRLVVDLAKGIEIKQINTYSWHPNTRGPQLYKVYGSDGKAEGFNAQPKKETDPLKCGWKLIASVDTRPKDGEGGGQYGVSISNSEGSVGKYRYLLFDIARTEDSDAFGNTFYSEIDVVGQDSTTADADAEPAADAFVTHSPDGYCEITIDTSGAPDLKEWAETKLAPVLADWYPKIVAMLPSEDYEPPKKFSVVIRPGRGVAATGGTRVTANSDWLKRELKGEAIGALLHEEVHVVQQYGWGRRSSPDAPRVRTPGFLTEGIPDYIRWFKYEPQTHGADVTWMKARRNLSLQYDIGYRVSANFLNYVVETYDQGLIKKLNAACRQHTYNEEIWKTATGKTLAELADEWKSTTEKQVAAARATPAEQIAATQTITTAESPINALTEAERAAGWKLLFNGKDFTGWHNFKREGVRPGWQIKDGALVCVDPKNAGDIVTSEQFDWFELQLDYNISEAGNSGIMFHVTDEGNAVWATGPEFQLEDNVAAKDQVRCGWLYALYQPPIDPKTDKPLDATKPVGEWNHVRLLISPQNCVHEINGVKYFEYVLGSDDFNDRVAKSKFRSMPHFAKSNRGYIALQGDHGQVSFRNIKVLPIKPST